MSGARQGSAALFVADRGVAVALGDGLAGEPLVARRGSVGAKALALGVELVVGEAALVQAGAALVQVGLGALARGLLLGVLGPRLAVLGVRAMGGRDLVAPADELALAGPSRVRAAWRRRTRGRPGRR